MRERTISQKLTSFPPMCPDVHVCTCASVLQINKCYKKKISDQNQIGFKISGGLVLALLLAFFRIALDVLFVSFRFKFIIKIRGSAENFHILFQHLISITVSNSFPSFL